MFLLICLGFTLKPNKQGFFVLIPFFFSFPTHIYLQAEERLKKDSLAEGKLLREKPSYCESDTFICLCGEGIILNLKKPIKLLTEISIKNTLNAENVPPLSCTLSCSVSFFRHGGTCKELLGEPSLI